MLKRFLFLFLILSISFVSAVDILDDSDVIGVNIISKQATFNNQTAFVNNTQFFQGLIPTDFWLAATNQVGFTGDKTGSFDMTSTGVATYGSSYPATIGDDGNSRAGYFTDTNSNVAKLADGSWAGYFYKSSGSGALWASDGTRSAYFADGTSAGYFDDGTRTATLVDSNSAGLFSDGTRQAYLADGTQAGQFHEGSTSNDVNLANSNYAGDFTLASGTSAVHASDSSSNTADLATGSYSGNFRDSNSNYVTTTGSGSSYVLEVYHSTGKSGAIYAYDSSSGNTFAGATGSYGGRFTHSSSGITTDLATSSYGISAMKGGGSSAGYFSDGSSNVATLVDGTYAVQGYNNAGTSGGYFLDAGSSNAVILASGTYAVDTEDNVYFGASIYTGLPTNSAVYTDGSSVLTTDIPSGANTSLWNRTGTTLIPAIDGDNITTTGVICDANGCIGGGGGDINGTSINVTSIEIGGNFYATDDSNYTYFSKQEDIGLCFNLTHIIIGEAITGQCG